MEPRQVILKEGRYFSARSEPKRLEEISKPFVAFGEGYPPESIITYGSNVTVESKLIEVSSQFPLAVFEYKPVLKDLLEKSKQIVLSRGADYFSLENIVNKRRPIAMWPFSIADYFWLQGNLQMYVEKRPEQLKMRI